MPTVSFDELVSFGTQVLVKHGFNEEEARYIAETSATTEAAGVATHGMVLIAAIDAQAGRGVDVGAEPKIVKEKGATALIDGNKAAGGCCMKLAVKLAREKAKENGAAVIAVRNTSWLAGLGAWILPLVREGFFAQLLAQSCSCQDSAAVGSVDPCFSTNPIAIGFPAGDDTVMGDFSTAVMSMGKVNTFARAGKKPSQPVFFSKSGELTDDPQAMLDGGAMMTAGGDLDGHKGYTLALWIEALTAMAGGSCNNPEVEQRQCFTLMVFDPEAFEGGAGYDTEMNRFVSRIRNSRKRPGVDSIRLPGERMLKQLASSKENGVPLPDAMFEKLKGVAEKNGIEPVKVMA